MSPRLEIDSQRFFRSAGTRSNHPAKMKHSAQVTVPVTANFTKALAGTPRHAEATATNTGG